MSFAVSILEISEMPERGSLKFEWKWNKRELGKSKTGQRWTLFDSQNHWPLTEITKNVSCIWVISPKWFLLLYLSCSSLINCEGIRAGTQHRFGVKRLEGNEEDKSAKELPEMKYLKSKNKFLAVLSVLQKELKSSWSFLLVFSLSLPFRREGVGF